MGHCISVNERLHHPESGRNAHGSHLTPQPAGSKEGSHEATSNPMEMAVRRDKEMLKDAASRSNVLETEDCKNEVGSENIISKEEEVADRKSIVCLEDWSIPRSNREPWKKYLKPDYWKELRANKHATKVNKEVDVSGLARGNVTSVSADHPKVFAIFVSSTFTDTEEERNLLIEDVQPYLREVCSLFAYEFRFCEMRWGVRDEASEDHQTANLCMQELHRCQEESCGINFITLLCDKYGYCPFPSQIPKDEFEELISYFEDETNKQVVTKWFQLDENKLKAEYVLQKISTILVDYNSEDNENRKKARDQWWSEFEIMQKALKIASSKLKCQERRKFYEISVTEFEVLNGLLEIDNPNQTTFMINRKISKIEENEKAKIVGKFIDIDWITKSVNKESRERLLELKSEKVPKVLDSHQIKHYEIEWSEMGINKESHMAYLQSITNTICEVVLNSMTQHFILEDAVADTSRSLQDKLANEVKQGAIILQKLTKGVLTRSEIVERIHGYCLKEGSGEETMSLPLIIHGESGSGKSTIVATVISHIIDELTDNSAVVFRFIGMTSDSGNTKSLLSSLIQQFRLIRGFEYKEGEIPYDHKILAKVFKHEIKELSADLKIMIFLDALDQLSDVDIITEIEWLPTELPSNVKIVISCAPSNGSSSVYFEYLRNNVDAKSFIFMENLDVKNGGLMLDKWLEIDKRRLTMDQREVVQNALTHCPLPLFLKISYDETRNWHSYTSTESHPMNTAELIGDLISQLYKRLSIMHGKLLFERSIAYLTVARDGLSRQEIEDILSCDDDVLNDIFQWWIPPIRRIPQLQVVRLLSDLSAYLTESVGLSDGIHLLRWFHRQFKEEAQRSSQDTQNLPEIHQTLAHYFSGHWSQSGKPYLDMKNDNKEVVADRKIPRNPLVLQGNLIKSTADARGNKSLIVGSDCKINNRRLHEHCYHLIKGELLHEVAEVLCDLKYIQCKTMRKQGEELRQEYALALEVGTNKDWKERQHVEDFNSFFLQRGHVLKRYPSLVYQEAANYKTNSSVCNVYHRSEYKPLFILKASAGSTEDSLQSVLQGHTESVISIAFQTINNISGNLLVSGSLDGRIKIWNGISASEVSSFKGHTKSVNHLDFIDNDILSISADGKMFLWNAENFSRKILFEVKDETGSFVAGNCCKLAMIGDTKMLISAWDDGIVRVGNMDGRWQLKTEGHNYPATSLSLVGSHLTVGYADGKIEYYNVINLPDEALGIKKSDNIAIEDCLNEVFDILEHDGLYIVVGKQKNIRTQYSEDSNSGWAKNHFKNDSIVKQWVDEGMEYTKAIQTKMDLEMSSTGTFVVKKNKDGSYAKEVVKGLPTPHEYVSADLFFPYLATGGSDGNVHIWLIDVKEENDELSVSHLLEFGGHSLEINQLCFSADGNYLASASDDTDIRIWNMKEIRKRDEDITKRMKMKYKITGCISDFHGVFAVTWGKRGQVSAWNMEESKSLWNKICCSGEDINSAAITANGGKVMVAGDNYYELLNGETGSTYDVKRSCVGRKVRVLDFSSDGKTALLGDNCDIRLVVVEPAMQPLGFNDVTWKAHKGQVTSGHYCTGIYHIVSGSKDGIVKFWNEKQECLTSISVGSPVQALSFNCRLKKIAFVVEGEIGQDVVAESEDGKCPGLVDSNRDISMSSEKEALPTNVSQKEEMSPAVADDLTNDYDIKVADGDDNDDAHAAKVFDDQSGNTAQVGGNTWFLPTAPADSQNSELATPLFPGLDELSFPAQDRNKNEPFIPPFPNIEMGAEFTLPPMSEEMMKNLENLQNMLMNPPDMSEMSPPPPPPMQNPGPHRLQKKERRQIQYQEKTTSGTSTIALFDFQSNSCSMILQHSYKGLVACTLSYDCKILYSSSLEGEIYVWRDVDGDWFDVARYVTEDEAYISRLGDKNDEILAASKDCVQTLTVISN